MIMIGPLLIRGTQRRTEVTTPTAQKKGWAAYLTTLTRSILSRSILYKRLMRKWHRRHKRLEVQWHLMIKPSRFWLVFLQKSKRLYAVY